MTTEISTQHRFDATILGKEVRGQTVAVKLDWKLPSAKYELVLYLDPDDAELLDVGERLQWAITRGGLGKDRQGNVKEGKYPTDFFWDWDKDGSAAARVSPTVYNEDHEQQYDKRDDAERSMEEDFIPGKPTATQPGLTNKEKVEELFAGKPEPQIDGFAQRDSEPGYASEEDKWDKISAIKDEKIRKAQAFNAAVSFMVSPDYPHSFTDDVLGDIPHQLQELWHRIYWEVIAKGVNPEGWCFEHEQPRRPTKSGILVHQLGEQWCSEDGLLDAEGKLVE